MSKRNAPVRTDSALVLDLKGERRGYLRLATRPLHILIFLIPLIALYEYGAWRYLGTDPETRETILAQRMLENLFNSLGVPGVHMPAILAGVVLVLWHMMTRDRWRVRPTVVLGMWCEAAVWTAPMLVLGVILSRALGVSIEGAAQPAIEDPSLGEGLTIAVGAGLYEELLFRLLGFAVVLLIFEDLLGMAKKWAVVLALVITSLLFSWYHAPMHEAGGVNWPLATYFAVAGLYFGVVFISRGFGIAVGVHALYDIVVTIDPFA